MWHCITGCLHSLEISDIGHQVVQYHIPKEWRHQLPDFMELHSRRWQSSAIIVFRIQCKNEGRSLQICYSKCVIIYLLASQHHLAETFVYVWEFLTVVSVAKCQEQNRLYFTHFLQQKSCSAADVSLFLFLHKVCCSLTFVPTL
jgi:hypothetical protein